MKKNSDIHISKNNIILCINLLQRLGLKNQSILS